uniref:hypothetical protein n=1 Tax=Herbidospora sakaeratensis TaxID=564415 RepID=UPI000780895E|nr:hypothetical protein [Herbidospora sakaeratensis]
MNFEDRLNFQRGMAPYQRRVATLAGMQDLIDFLGDHRDFPLPSNYVEIELWKPEHSRRATATAEQAMAQALTLIGEMEDVTVELAIVNGTPHARVVINGRMEGVFVTATLWAEGICEHRPDEKRKRDRWVVPTQLIEAANKQPSGGDDRG